MAAADIIGKGLDPSHPHSVIGHDGLIEVPSVMEAAQPPAVIAISAPEVPPTPAPVESIVEVVEPSVPSEKEEEPKKVEEETPLALPSSEGEKAPEDTSAPVAEVVPVVEAPKKSGKAPKAPKA